MAKKKKAASNTLEIQNAAKTMLANMYCWWKQICVAEVQLLL